MRVFLDTNVLVSAFATRGLSADVLRHVLAEHELIIGEVVLEELQRTLKDKLGFPHPEIQEIRTFLEEHTLQPKPKAASAVRVRDADDQWVLASALAARADVLVTGDKDLLDVSEKVTALRITDPRGFWRMLRKP